MPLGNCTKCGVVFLRTNNSLCPKCVKKEEADFQKAVLWLRENPDQNIKNLSKATEIEEGEILRWIRQERLTMKGASSSVKCHSCGNPIETGTLCSRCKLRIAEEVDAGIKKLKNQGETPNLGRQRGMHYSPEERRREGKSS
jgi:predicted amidophosphoribosyltransferase